MEENNQIKMQEIEQLLKDYKNSQTPEQSKELLEKMSGVRFIVPVTFPQDETLAAMQAELARTGQPVRLPKDAKPIPVLIQNPNKEHFLAVYTSLAQIPKEHHANGVIEMAFEGCMNYVKNAKNPVRGVVVNPFSDNFMIQARKQQQVTPAQFHVLARKNVEYVLLPHTIYTKDKDYFDSIDAGIVEQYFKDQYQNKLPMPYDSGDFDVMQLGIDPQLDLIHISMPTKKAENGAALRIYVTWHKKANCPGYYMIVRGEKKDERRWLYIQPDGGVCDLGEAPVESTEMQQVMQEELSRHTKQE